MINYHHWLSQDAHHLDTQRQHNEARAAAIYGAGKSLVGVLFMPAAAMKSAFAARQPTDAVPAPAAVHNQADASIRAAGTARMRMNGQAGRSRNANVLVGAATAQSLPEATGSVVAMPTPEAMAGSSVPALTNAPEGDQVAA